MGGYHIPGILRYIAAILLMLSCAAVASALIDEGSGIPEGDLMGGDTATGPEFYLSEKPSDSQIMTDAGPAASEVEGGGDQNMLLMIGPSKCGLWIVDRSGLNRQLSLNMPLYRYARVEVTTCSSGDLVFYERDPSGQISTGNVGQVRSNWKYLLWYRTENVGTTTIWYTIGDERSNEIKFIVPGDGQGQSGDGCTLRTDKAQYGVGETATIYYTVSAPCTIKLTVTRPDGYTTTIGPRTVKPGTYNQQGEISMPLGQRTVRLETSNGLRCSKTAYFDVVDMPLFYRDDASGGSISGSGQSDSGQYDSGEYGDGGYGEDGDGGQGYGSENEWFE